jgi:ATP synthase I chain.
MNHPARVVASGVRRVLIVQLLLSVAVAICWLVYRDWMEALTALYGGGVASLNSLLLARSVHNASIAASATQKSGQLTLYAGAVQRFVFVLAALIVGMGLLRLPPLPLITGFAGAQLGYLTRF